MISRRSLFAGLSALPLLRPFAPAPATPLEIHLTDLEIIDFAIHAPYDEWSEADGWTHCLTRGDHRARAIWSVHFLYPQQLNIGEPVCLYMTRVEPRWKVVNGRATGEEASPATVHYRGIATVILAEPEWRRVLDRKDGRETESHWLYLAQGVAGNLTRADGEA